MPPYHRYIVRHKNLLRYFLNRYITHAIIYDDVMKLKIASAAEIMRLYFQIYKKKEKKIIEINE